MKWVIREPEPPAGRSDEIVAPTVARSPACCPPTTKPLGEVIKIDEVLVQEPLGEVVRSIVEETLNALLDPAADRLCGAKRYERSPDRVDTRAGHHERQLHTRAGRVTLQILELRSLPFKTAIIKRYRRRETSVEEALSKMCYAGISVRGVSPVGARSMTAMHSRGNRN